MQEATHAGTHARIGTALVVLGLVAVPTAGAATFNFDDLTRFFIPSTPPAPHYGYEGLDLSQSLGKFTALDLTGLEDLAVIEYAQFTVQIERGVDGLTIRQTPNVAMPHPSVDYAPVQNTLILDSTDLTLFTTATHMWIDGDAPQPAALATDPGYIFQNNIPDVGIVNVVPLEDTKPLDVAGAASYTVKTFDTNPEATDPRAVADLFILDVDDVFEIGVTEPTYAPGTVTTAATASGIQSMLEGLAVTGTAINTVLGALKVSTTREVGIVSPATVAADLVQLGFTVERVDDASLEPKTVAYPSPSVRKFVFVNPTTLSGELLMTVNGVEFASIDEGKVIALKDTDADHVTRLGALFHGETPADADTNAKRKCLCAMLVDFEADVGGVTKVAGLIPALRPRMPALPATPDATAPDLGFLTQVDVGSHAGNAATGYPTGLPTLPVDTQFKWMVAGDVDAVTRDRLEFVSGLGQVPTLEQPSMAWDLPDYKGDTLAIYNAKIGATDKVQDAKVLELIEAFETEHRVPTIAICTECLSAPNLGGVAQYLSQIETFETRNLVPVDEAEVPTGAVVVALGSTGGLVQYVAEGQYAPAFQGLYGVLRFRAVTTSTRTAVEGADIVLNVYTAGFKGFTLQTYTAETNELGYAVFTVLPHQSYNYTVELANHAAVSGAGATPGAGETDGEEVQMTPQSGFAAAREKVGDPRVFGLALLALVGAMVLLTRAKTQRAPRPKAPWRRRRRRFGRRR